MRIRLLQSLAFVACGLALAACDEPVGDTVPSEAGWSAQAGPPAGDASREPVPAGVAPQNPNPLGFEVWHADFPGAPELPYRSPRRPGLWYDRTPRQALESIAEKLQGNCSRDAWLMAKDFFSRIDPEDIDVLIAALDRGLQVPEKADHVENLVEAIGRAHAPAGADALLRALEHPRETIRNKVMYALIGSGTADAVRQARGMFSAVDGRGMKGWLQAALAHLPPEEVAGDCAAILADPRLRMIWDAAAETAFQLPPQIALRTFESVIGNEPARLEVEITALRHAAGDAGGTSRLADLLRRPEPQIRRAAVESMALGGAEELLDQVLRLTTDPDATVRLATVNLLTGIRSSHVDLALESMAGDEAQDVRRAALAALAQRGRNQALDELVDVVRNGTGSRLTFAMQDLIAARYGGAVAAMAERMRAAPVDERMEYLRAIALTTTREGFGPLREVFLADDEFARQNRSLVAYLMANSRGAEAELVALFRSLPTEDYQRRALLMGTLANVAADRETEEVQDPIYALLRGIIEDREEIPQIRLLALGYLRRDLVLEDLRAIKGALADEAEPMRKALTDFLFEFY